MKRILTFAMMLLFTAAVFAQNNDKISYQAVVRTSDNVLVYDQDLTVTIAIANSATGTAVYGEKHDVTSNANGLISLMIGDGNEKTGNWDNIEWNHAWVTATIKKGSEQLAQHHVPMSAVPYALYAEDVNCDAVNACVGDGKLTITDGTNDNKKEYTANQTGDQTVTLGKAAFTNNYNDLTDKPTIPAAANDGKITIKDAEGNTIGEFTVDQANNQIITLPANPVQKSKRFTYTAGQTSFSVSDLLPTGWSIDFEYHVAQMYINGVYVGDQNDGVVGLASDKKSFTYNSANNGNYVLTANDRVQFVFWIYVPVLD